MAENTRDAGTVCDCTEVAGDLGGGGNYTGEGSNPVPRAGSGRKVCVLSPRTPKRPFRGLHLGQKGYPEEGRHLPEVRVAWQQGKAKGETWERDRGEREETDIEVLLP